MHYLRARWGVKDSEEDCCVLGQQNREEGIRNRDMGKK